MGNVTSSVLYAEELEDLERKTIFSQTEIENLYERFKMIDRNSSGIISLQSLLMIPEFISNPMSYRFIRVLEKYTNYEPISFPVFLDIMQIFSTKYDVSKRIEFVFNIFDLHGDGKLCKNVFLKLFKDFLKNNKSAVDDIFIYYDKECKGYLDYSDFHDFYVRNNYDEIFTLRFDNRRTSRKIDNDLFSFF
ncbi:Calcineurin subunit B [Dictyocoela muelleri]|nr:Calcineurin subunit B [Dictyocoela muelleri]